MLSSKSMAIDHSTKIKKAFSLAEQLNVTRM